MHRDLPKLNINVGKDKQEYVKAKRTKKSIKQNIFESISPTFIRRIHVEKQEV